MGFRRRRRYSSQEICLRDLRGTNTTGKDMKRIFHTLLLSLFCCYCHSQLSLARGSYKNLAITITQGNNITVEKDLIKINIAADSIKPRLEIAASNGYWYLSDKRFLHITVQNTGKTPQTVEAGLNDNFWTMGATLIPPGKTKTIRVLLLKDEKDTALAALYSGMHGHPSGFARLWFDTGLDSVKKVVLYFPGAAPGSSFVVSNIVADGRYDHPADSGLINAFVDEFGQYTKEDWPEKIHSVQNMITADQKERRALALDNFAASRNKYGGWEQGPSLRATGHFRTEKYKNKWWLVDPAGRLFWSNGIDCINANGETRVTGRTAYFEKLPGRDTAKAFFSPDGSRFDFKSYNLFRKYGDPWKKQFSQTAHARLRNWGINTIGNWSDPFITAMNLTPFVASVSSKQTGGFADPFADGFREDLENKITDLFRQGGDPEWCIGLFIDNELKWKDLAANVFRADTSQPSKLAFIQFLQKKYTQIEELNNEWHTAYASWYDFSVARSLPGPAASPDLQEFSKTFADLYFRQCQAAMKKAAPAVLYFGCRFDFHSYPSDTSFNWLIKIASAYCDIVSFNRYTYTSAELAPPAGYDFPIIIGEFHFGSLGRGLLHPGLKYAADQKERAMLYQSFQEQAMKNPYVVGSHWFQYNDQPVTGRNDGENYQIGFVTVGDIPYSDLIDKARETAKKMYELRVKSDH